MNEVGDGHVAVPDLVGLGVEQARDLGHAAAVVVVAADVDGPPLGALTWPGTWVVTAQEPTVGTSVRRWSNVHVVFRRTDGGAAGDREPRRPSPGPHALEAQPTLDDS